MDMLSAYYNCGEDSSALFENLAFCFAKEYYTIIRELPTGKGFADINIQAFVNHHGCLCVFLNSVIIIV